MKPRVLLVAALLWAGSAWGARPEPSPEAFWVVDAARGLDAAAVEIRDFDPRRLATALELTGLPDGGGRVLVAIRSERSPEAAQVPGWVAGYARGRTGEVVLFPSRGRSWPDRSLESLFEHELTHVLVARAARGRPVPRWFNEGVAMAASRSPGLEDWTRFALERMRTGPVPLSQLDARFTGGEAQVRRAYAVAGAFVRHLVDRHGTAAVARTLALVGEGVPFEEAFRRATGESLGQAQATFWDTRGGLFRYLPFLTSSIAVWLLVTLLALIAVWRRRRKTAELERKWQEEDTAHEQVGT